MTRPDVVEAIHREYLEAGADMIETNTFSSATIAQADYGLEPIARELNREAARLARRACDAVGTPEHPRYVAGAVGPTNRTLSLSPDVNNPAFRAATFEELAVAYQEQVEGLIEGGVDAILIETIFDTLNAKAAIYGTEEAFAATGKRLPIMISVTIVDLSGRTLSGQTLEAFWISIKHARPLTVGLNCALGADQMRPYVEELAGLADCFTCIYPNAGLPNPLSATGYDETPEHMAGQVREWAERGWVNMLGGCCGTTPAFIAAMKQATQDCAPRAITAAEATGAK